METKSITLKLDLDTHRRIERIQEAEADQLSFVTRRRKEDLAADILKAGLKPFANLHELTVNLNGDD